ncbi:MAG: nitrous oxide-stimulated promoter family protein [Bacteroidales bacterium]
MKETKIHKEQRIVSKMIDIYARKYDFPEAEELKAYAIEKLEHCTFGENKPSCRKCPIHCYKTDMRTLIKKVMRYSGPRMIFYAPLEIFKH